ncbi:hypothetical protein RFI_31630 [Reticulomyxa filosa]|uniref:Uncharacterized protein n=1 Tax=Reticulomyxa filosa TaxID=46433 RepID=X6LWM5_RETFI|nr:hypothetical protein RFI_31630 [Reticulomyxa filosa]|eukprot:ETO05766.1 hypothetical protein RFI_31630 [Reticulomyxa filosa]
MFVSEFDVKRQKEGTKCVESPMQILGTRSNNGNNKNGDGIARHDNEDGNGEDENEDINEKLHENDNDGADDNMLTDTSALQSNLRDTTMPTMTMNWRSSAVDNPMSLPINKEEDNWNQSNRLNCRKEHPVNMHASQCGIDAMKSESFCMKTKKMECKDRSLHHHSEDSNLNHTIVTFMSNIDNHG